MNDNRTPDETRPRWGLGHYLGQPSSARRRAEQRAVTRLSLASHAAAFHLYTPGESLNAADTAERLRSIADDFDAIAGVSLGALDFWEAA